MERFKFLSCMAVLIVVIVCWHSLRISSLEPIPVQEPIETLEIRELTKQDYQTMVSYCFTYLKEQNISVFNSQDYEFADGSSLEFESSVYADEPVYFSNVLLMRFVSESHDIISVISGIEGAYGVDSLHLFSTDNSSTSLALTEADEVILYQLVSLWQSILSGKPFTNELFISDSVYLDTNSVDFGNISLLYSGLGKTDLSIQYFDRCLLQFKTKSGVVTVLLKLSQDGYIIDVDTL